MNIEQVQEQAAASRDSRRDSLEGVIRGYIHMLRSGHQRQVGRGALDATFENPVDSNNNGGTTRSNTS